MSHPNLDEIIDGASLAKHLENTPFGVMLWDRQKKLVYCSKGAAAVFGCTPDELLQKPFDLIQFVHPDDAQTVSMLIEELTSGRTTHSESLNRNRTKEGTILYCQWYNSALKDEAGMVMNILSLFQDVTAQVETQLALKKSQQQLSLVFNSAIDPMWLIRAEGNNIFWFETINHAFTTVTGWTAEQVEGQPIEKIMPVTSHDLVRTKYNEALVSGRIIDYVEEALHPSGIKYGEIRVIPIRGEAGEPVRILGIANDITEKVYLQRKLDAERESRSRYITSAAIRGQESERSKVSRELHDNVNQVLTTVKLFIELCLDQKVKPADILPKCVDYLHSAINEIRSLSKQLSAPSLGHLNFRDNLVDLVESVRAAAQLEITIDLAALPFQTMDDELHLTIYRIVQEQLTNVIKHAKASQVAVSLEQKKAELHLSISDNGVGFDPSQKSKGIGITNMRSRVEILNGSFRLDSTPGAGTRLDTVIPVIIEDNICYAEQTVLNTNPI